jgi:flavin reductase (DIM6/NTAB) family NADH-FMN oxidoreductase RutF
MSLPVHNLESCAVSQHDTYYHVIYAIILGKSQMECRKVKVERKPLPLIYPNPVVLVTTVDTNKRTNIITLTLVGGVCWEPPMIGVGVGKDQHSRILIEKLGEFVVNIPKAEMLRDVEYCGLVSGREVDKWSKTSFTPVPSSKVRPPMIKECPVNLECKVKNEIPLGSNILFVAEVVCLHVEEEMLGENGGVNMEKAEPIMFNLTDAYWGIGKKLASYGFTRSLTEMS